MEYVWIAVRPIMHILFIDEAIQPEMSLIAVDDFSIEIPNKVVAQLNSRTYNASVGQAASVLASISFCKDVSQDYFAKFATTLSQRCPTLENDV